MLKYLVFSLFAFQLAADFNPNVELFCHKYSGPAYQDLWVDHECIRQGTDQCSVRYEMLLPILNQYTGPFSVLDLGAAQGYFSFRIAEDFPEAKCTMIGANTNYYGNHGDMLYDLCFLNNHLQNITYLNQLVNLQDLKKMSRQEHFDVLLALLVIHQIDESFSRRVAVIETLLEMADKVIIEVSNDVAPELGTYVEALSQKIQSIYLGEVRRHHNLSSKATGKLFCFMKERKKNTPRTSFGVSPQTFLDFHGVYP